MTTATASQPTHAVLIARMRDGSGLYLSRLLRGPDLVDRRGHAKVATMDDAIELRERLHQVMALGHYWKDVSYFDVCPTKAPRTRKPTR